MLLLFECYLALSFIDFEFRPIIVAAATAVVNNNNNNKSFYLIIQHFSNFNYIV